VPDRETHVIIGAGLAGAKTAEALRAEGFEGRIILVGAEAELPYERPPLSKSYLLGKSERASARVHDEEWYADNDVELRTDTTVEGIDVATRRVALDGGERVRFERLVIATGAEPRRLTIPGGDLSGLHYLRDFADADALKQVLRAGGRLVVIGAGWIGMEVAAAARQYGLDVTVVEPAGAPLERALGPALGGFYAEVHRDHGVELLTGVAPERFEGVEAVERVVLNDGRDLDASGVVVGIGITPRIALAEQAGLLVDNGIVVNERLQASVPAIYAAGDVASAFHPWFGRHVRVEHWANALNQPAVAARSMLRKPASYDRQPYFFSDQYDVGMEFTGDPTGSDELVIRGDLSAREFIAFWLKADRVIAGMNVNVWDVTDDIKELIGAPGSIDSARLADSEVSLSELAGAAARAGS
jgi:3-phenylpropionate/trans-cinnamate dioxygenase ferredoxin reductase subunit